MKRLTVVNADSDKRGALKENIFIALDGNGEYAGSAFIYPFLAADLEPEHPHNLYLHLHTEREKGAGEAVKDLLLENALRRATEIKNEAEQTKTRIYACFFKHQREEIAYFLERGFAHDEGMYVLARQEPAELPEVEVPKEVSIQCWRMETDAEQRRFIETHREIFPRHPYNTGRLQELMLLPGWNDFAAFRESEIAGNIMLYLDSENDMVGWIEDLFVHKQWRRQGIAKCLLYTALRHFQDIGVHHVELEMWSANKPALHLYRAFGFSAIDETEIAVGRYV